MWVLNALVPNVVEMTHSSRMSAVSHTLPTVTSANTAEPLIQRELRRSDSDVHIYLQKKCSSVQVTAKKFIDLALHPIVTKDF